MNNILKIVLIATLFLSMVTGGCGGKCNCGCIDTDVDVSAPKDKKTGELNVTIADLQKMASGPEKKYVSVTYSGVLKNASGQGETGETSFSRSVSYEIVQGNVMPQPNFKRVALKFGTWEVTVQSTNWTAKCEGQVLPDKGGSFQFTFPSTSGTCN